MLRPALYARGVFAAGCALTLTTGAGLWGWPGTVSFAWEIGAPLTAAWMGAWYLAAAWALVQAARSPDWSRARIVAIVAFTLTTASLVATIRFSGEFRFGEGGSLEQAIAWTWLLVYVALPAVVLVMVAHHARRAGPERGAGTPLQRPTRIVLAALALVAAALAIWLTAAPDRLERVWPWPLADLPASIVGTWLITLAAGAAWGLRENDWRRCRIVLWPCLFALALQLVALARLHGTLIGGPARVSIYVAAISLAMVALLAVGLLEERRLADVDAVSAGRAP